MRPESPLSRLLLVTAVVAACAPETTPSTPAALTDQDRAAIVQTIFGYADEWSAVTLSKDVAALDRILAPDFIYTVDNGDLHDKESFIALYQNDPNTCTRAEGSDLKAHWYSDDVVVITGVFDTECQDPEGNAVTGKGRWTNVYMHRDGEWRCVVGHSTDVGA